MSSNTLSTTPFFIPTQISGCQMWFDASDPSTVTVSGTAVIQWRDKSGNGFNMGVIGTQSNAIVSRNFQNNLNVLNLTGRNVYRTPINSGVYPSDCYIVLASKALARTDFISIGNTTSDNFNSLTLGEYTATRWHNGSSGFARTPNTVSPTNETSTGFLLMNWSLANNNFVIRRNTLTLSQTASYTYTLGGNPALQIGYRHTDQNVSDVDCNAYLAEIVVYNSQLGLIQRQQIEGYLAWKWGLQGNLPSNHPYKNSFPATSITQSIRANLANTMSTSPSPFLFNPTSIPNCALWFDAADRATIVANGISLTSWANKGSLSAVSITTRGLVASTGNISSTGLNFLNVPFAGELRFTAALNNQARSWFWVVRNNTPASSWQYMQLIYPAQAAGGQDQIYIFNGGSSFDMYQQPFNSVKIAATVLSPIGSTRMYTLINSATTASNAIRSNGSNNSLSVTQVASGYNTNSLTYSINISDQANYRTSLDIFEILFFQRALSVFESQQIEGYLAWKWGLVPNLPTAHPYKNAPPGLPVPSAPLRLQMTTNGFSPLSISGCGLWLDASKDSRRGTVTSITDLTSNAYVGSIVSATVQQSFLNKLNVWYFPSYNLRFNAFPWRTRFTLIFLLNTAGFAMTSQRVGGTGSYITYYLSGNCYLFTVNGYGTLYGSEGTAGSCGPDITPKNQWVIMVFAYNGGTRPSFYRFNGVDRTNVNSVGAGAADTTITDSMAINGAPSSTTDNSSNTYYAEHIHYNAGLSLYEIQKVEGYLAWKWGLQGNLPTTHPFKRWPPSPG